MISATNTTDVTSVPHATSGTSVTRVTNITDVTSVPHVTYFINVTRVSNAHLGFRIR